MSYDARYRYGLLRLKVQMGTGTVHTLLGLYDRSTSTVTHQSIRLGQTAQQVLSHFFFWCPTQGIALVAAMDSERGRSLSLDGIFGRRSLVAKSAT